MAASLFDHPGFLLIIAAVALLRWLIQKGKGDAQNTETQAPPSTPSQPITRGGETQTEEERVRKFLEALGQPARSAPPKMAPRRREVQPRIFPRLPPLTTAPPPMPEASELRTPTPPGLPVELVTARTVTVPEFEVRDVARQTSSEPPPEIQRTTAAGFAARIKLGTPQDLRTAIVLREIFGPPRSFQPFDSLT
ncbi:MAG: hypothetical protein DME97_10795 [Verrucomicrobia bacterium]|nr:MAG: hypothetical protein DME97_10795 [Verrucomicrobiota bacterium]